MPSNFVRRVELSASADSGEGDPCSPDDSLAPGEARVSDPPPMQAAHLRTGSRSHPPVTLRTDTRLGKGDAAEAARGARFDEFEAEWRREFRETSLAARYRYEQLAPAYRHGGVLALSDRFAQSDWNDIEKLVRREWEQRNPGTWEQAREAIRCAWHSVRARLRASVGHSAA